MKKILFVLASLALGGGAPAQSGALLVDSNGTVRTTNRVTFPGDLNVTGSLLTNGSPLAAGGGGASNVSEWARSTAVTNIDAGGFAITNMTLIAPAGAAQRGTIDFGQGDDFGVDWSGGGWRSIDFVATNEISIAAGTNAATSATLLRLVGSDQVSFASAWTNAIRNAVPVPTNTYSVTVSNGLVLNGTTNGASSTTNNVIALPLESAQRAFARSTNTYALVFGSTNTWHAVSNSYAVAQFPGTVSASSAGVVVSNAGTYMVRYDAALAFPTSSQYRYGLLTNGALAPTSTRVYRATGATTWEGPAGIADVLDLPAGALLTPAAWAAAGAGSTLQISNVVITVQRIPATP